VEREFWLVDDKDNKKHKLLSGDAVPRGAYLACVVTVAPPDDARYLVVENPPPSGCEVVPVTDPRFHQAGTPCALRADREAHVAYHHEEAGGKVVDRCVLHTETAGEFIVPAARAEMMYQTEVRGHSGAFRLRVVER